MVKKDWKKIDVGQYYNKKKDISIRITKSGLRDISTRQPLYNVVFYDYKKDGKPLFEKIKFLKMDVKRPTAVSFVNKYMRMN